MKGYKVFKSDWTCRDFQYKVGEVFEHNGEIAPCREGFHFCENLIDCFNYYPYSKSIRVAEIEALGEIIKSNDKYVTNKIKIVREIPQEEVIKICNLKLNNDGIGNTGEDNKGHYNSGCFNKGNCNVGDTNIGHSNTGDSNIGDYNTGHYNDGTHNSGLKNQGNGNFGNFNFGDGNTGNFNYGNGNSDHLNIGDGNTGCYNYGYGNSGFCNQGQCNTGYWNKTDYSTGFFNTNIQIYMFNKPVNLQYSEVLKLEGIKILEEKMLSILGEQINKMEKSFNNSSVGVREVEWEILSIKENYNKVWGELTENEKQMVKDLPNFDAKIFFEITGIDIDKDFGGNKK